MQNSSLAFFKIDLWLILALFETSCETPDRLRTLHNASTIAQLPPSQQTVKLGLRSACLLDKRFQVHAPRASAYSFVITNGLMDNVCPFNHLQWTRVLPTSSCFTAYSYSLSPSLSLFHLTRPADRCYPWLSQREQA